MTCVAVWSQVQGQVLYTEYRVRYRDGYSTLRLNYSKILKTGTLTLNYSIDFGVGYIGRYSTLNYSIDYGFGYRDWYSALNCIQHGVRHRDRYCTLNYSIGYSIRVGHMDRYLTLNYSAE